MIPFYGLKKLMSVILSHLCRSLRVLR